MYFFKRVGLIFSAILFCLSILAITGNAQPGRARWEGNNGRHRGWENGNWRNGRGQERFRQSRSWRYGRINPWEARNLRRERIRLIRTRNRFYRNDGYINYGERRRLAERYRHYRRDVRRDRRNW